jgi:chemotaxis protein methyltransferase CheR
MPLEEMFGSVNNISLEEQDYMRLSRFIISQYGIKLTANKKTMVECRLQKRLKQLQYDNFKSYVDFVFSAEGIRDEVDNMIDAISTNKTDFFREPVHFDFLMNHGIKDYVTQTRKSKLNIWSAGCSSGEEPYTIAIVLKEYAAKNQFIDFDILATDISESVLQHAVVGIYTEEKISVIPAQYKFRYLLRGKNSYQNKFRIKSEIRNKIEFRKFNLLGTGYSELDKFDIIFCRNVMIYFDRLTQKLILDHFCNLLNPGGYLFLGHSESLTGFDLPLKQVIPTVFAKKTDGFNLWGI